VWRRRREFPAFSKSRLPFAAQFRTARPFSGSTVSGTGEHERISYHRFLERIPVVTAPVADHYAKTLMVRITKTGDSDDNSW
jgi:hypothetical protein